MSVILERPARPLRPTFAQGMGSLSDIAAAGRDSMLYVDNSNAANMALQRALSERIEAIHAATGARLENPLERAEREWRRLETERPQSPMATLRTERPTRDQMFEREMARFEGELFSLGEKFPDARQAIGADRPLWQDAARLAREADERLGQLMESRPGLGKWGALLTGGLAGALNDPITIASFALGAGPGAARTVAGRILQVAGREAMINAGAEAAIQPMVQAWREQIGVDHGLDQAIRNVLFAGTLGAAFGGTLRGAQEGFSAIAGRIRPEATENAAEILRQARTEGRSFSEAADAILDGNALRAAESLETIRPALPPEARGALDQAAIIRHTDEQRPRSASPDHHDMTVARADAALTEMEAWPGFSPDPAQIARVAREIAGEETGGLSPVQSGERSLVGFLVDRGGLRDDGGDLRHMGADAHVERFRGRLVRGDGEELDMAREAAAQAGYFDHIHGTPEAASNRSTVAEFLELIEEELRGNPTYPGGPAGAQRMADEQAARAGLEATIDRIARMGGPALDDATLVAATRRVIDEGLDEFDALEAAILAAERAGDASTGSGRATDDIPPGWSDEDLLAASDRRGPPPDTEGGLDNPARLADDADTDLAGELAGLDPETLVPDPYGEGLIPVQRLVDDLERGENMLRVTQACRA